MKTERKRGERGSKGNQKILCVCMKLSENKNMKLGVSSPNPTEVSSEAGEVAQPLSEHKGLSSSPSNVNQVKCWVW